MSSKGVSLQVLITPLTKKKANTPVGVVMEGRAVKKGGVPCTQYSTKENLARHYYPQGSTSHFRVLHSVEF